MTTESQQHIATDNDEISLKELIFKIQEWWRYLLSKWIIILFFSLVGGTLGFFYASNKKAVYTATTTFVLEDEKAGGGGLGNLAGLASMAGVDLGSGGGGIFQGDNLLELYKSRKMIEKTLLTKIDFRGKKELLINRYIVINHLKDQWKSRPELLKINFNNEIFPNRLKDSLINQFVGDINKNYLIVAKPDKKLSIIKVDLKSKDEFFAKAFNDELVKNVNEFYVNTRTKKTLQNVQILKHKTDSVRAVMNGAIYTAVEVADATPNLNPTRQVKRVAPAQKAQFSAETNKTVLSALVQNLELSKMALLKEAPLIQVVDQPVLPLDVVKVGKLRYLVIGGIVMGCFIVLILTIKKFLSDLMNQ
ncbi:GumC domain-containing protein [Pedobacter nototheniae]|uniref:lipopolysaccharide biosynthesis protein n=1 Tax=Pedobacter nototheniae TaxID=2488994 RepID=UPI00103A976A|nr:lipopolysaccharide biosynthesis protein [Pedobacter nototheniae]